MTENEKARVMIHYIDVLGGSELIGKTYVKGHHSQLTKSI